MSSVPQTPQYILTFILTNSDIHVTSVVVALRMNHLQATPCLQTLAFHTR